MRKVKVKICGLKRAQDIECVNRLLPDYIGFVFAKTRREVTEQQAAQLKAMLNPQIKAVGVFVNAEIDLIVRLAKSRTIDIIQLHGDEAANVADVLKNSNAFAVDVSGGVETEGLKDPEKIAAFIAEVRGDNDDKR